MKTAQVKLFVTKPNNLSLVPGPYIVEERNPLWQVLL